MKLSALGGVVTVALSVLPMLAIARESELQAMAHRLSELSAQSPHHVSMRIAWGSETGHEYLRCFITNRSGHSLTVDGAVLPCTPFAIMRFHAFDTTGRTLYVDQRPVNMPVPPPEALVLNDGQTIDRAFDFSRLPIYKLADREDLNVVWSAHIELYVKPDSTKGMFRPDPPKQWLSGTTYVPKRQSPKRQ
jgi:hypothetical protein